MRKKIGLFTFLFVTVGTSNYLFIGRGEIWSALFVGFFTALIMAFVFVPLVEKPMLNVVKKLTAKYTKQH